MVNTFTKSYNFEGLGADVIKQTPYFEIPCFFAACDREYNSQNHLFRRGLQIPRERSTFSCRAERSRSVLSGVTTCCFRVARSSTSLRPTVDERLLLFAVALSGVEALCRVRRFDVLLSEAFKSAWTGWFIEIYNPKH